MKAVSLFSGVGGLDIGFGRAGIETVLQCENDPWCLSVLERHWPDVERVTDVRQVDATAWRGRCRDVERDGFSARAESLGDEARPTARIDLVYGGWPCQDHSVAGKRAGLRGDRGGLFYEFARVVRELRPRWIAAENVPGLLSSPTEAPGVDFGIVLRTLVDLGYGVAWRILDARWFGVPQRRRRPIIVGCLGNPHRAAQVLAVCESCGGHSQARGETGQDVAPTLDDGARRASVELPMIAVAATQSGGGHASGVNLPGRHHEDDENLVTVTLAPGAHPGGVTGGDAENGALVVASAVRTRYGDNGSPERGDLTLVVAGTLRASDGHHGHSSPRGNGADNLIAFQSGESFSSGNNSDISPTLRIATGVGAPSGPADSGAFGVRRLTPLECERLMGWPDGHTKYTADGREIPDSHRYRMIGNGVVSTVAEWIGHRLVRANSFMEGTE